MPLLQQINSDLKAALKNKDSIRVSTLRLLISAINYFLIDERKDTLSDDAVIGIIQKQVKQRNDSIESYQKGGRNELKEKEQAELHILESYLPQQLSDEDLLQLVKDVISDVGATSKKDMGLVIKNVLEKGKGVVDGKRASQCVSTFLK